MTTDPTTHPATDAVPLGLDRGVSVNDLAWARMDGLLPAIVQHADSGAVLMLGYMDEPALAATLATGRVTFYSRSRQRAWVKGETSGNFLHATGITADCDRDALLVRARPRGPVCHTGAADCFTPTAGDPPAGFLGTLAALLPARIAAGPEASYTARLALGGVRRVAQKVGEEGVEVALAAVAEDDRALAGEAADLLYHLAVLLEVRGPGIAGAVRELARRHAPGAAGTAQGALPSAGVAPPAGEA